ncbi:helix-turn-helix transcriptional regulator [soil metagenome]
MEKIINYSIESLKSSDTAVKEFDFFRFEYFAKDIDHLKAPHRHLFYTFILVTDGGGSHDIDFHTHPLRPGRLFLIAPGQVHAWNELKSVKGFVALFSDSFMALSKGRKVMSAWPLFRAHQSAYYDLTKSEQQEWINEFLFIEQEKEKNDRYSRDAIFYSISSLMVRGTRLSVLRVDNSFSIDHGVLFKFQELVEKNFIKLKTPKDYALLLNITPNYLNAVCKKKSGLSAGALIRQRIILEAKRLLAHTSLSVSEIAFKLNFEDNSYFGKVFKRSTNTTPESFRASQLS